MLATAMPVEEDHADADNGGRIAAHTPAGIEFMAMISEVGVTFSDTDVRTAVDPPNLRRSIQARLYQETSAIAASAPGSQVTCGINVKHWLEGLLDIFDDTPDALRAFLSPMIVAPVSTSKGKSRAPGSGSSANTATTMLSSSETFARVLLGVDEIQLGLLDLLIEKIPAFDGDEEIAPAECPVPRLILHQLRWLDHIVDPERLTNKLLEMLTVTSTTTRREIIAALPEIIDDGEYQNVIDALKAIMNESAELTTPILDALANMNLAPELLDDVRENVLGRLASADLDDLPVVVRFLLQSVTTDTAHQVIKQIRMHLDFRSLGRLSSSTAIASQRSSLPGTLNDRNAKKGAEALILEAVRSGIRFHKFVKDTWVKAISEIERPSQYKVLDILVIFILHPIAGMKKKVETLLQRKLTAGSLSPELVHEAISNHPDALREHFPALLSLAEALLRSSAVTNADGGGGVAGTGSAVGVCAKRMYEAIFEVADTFYRQEVIGSLVTHVGSGAASEVNVGLSALLAIVQRFPQHVQQFAIFVKGILDYLDNLQLPQIRELFEIYSLLAFEKDQSSNGGASSSSSSLPSKKATVTSSGFLNELSIVIRKQLQNPSEKYKQMGVVAALAIARMLCTKDSTAPTSGSVENDPMLVEAVKIFEMVLKNCEKFVPSLALAYDELARLVSFGNLDPRMEDWITENISGDFTEAFVRESELAEELAALPDLPPETWMNLDGDTCNIAIDVYPSLAAAAGASAQGRSAPVDAPVILLLCAKFKLFQACTKASAGGGLDDIDGLLGCGIIMQTKSSMTTMRTEYTALMRDVVCNALFYAINWLRELVNAFSTEEEDVEVKGKLIMRLRDIGTMEKTLQGLLEVTPDFVPLGSRREPIFDGVLAVGSLSTPPTAFATFGSSQSQSIRASDNVSLIDSDDDTANKSKTTSGGGSTSKGKNIVDLRLQMRELELDVFKVLRYSEVSRKLMDTNMEEKESVNLKLEHPELRYLLEDLHRKLERRLAPPTPVIPFFTRRARQPSNSDDLDPNFGFTLLDRVPLIEVVVRTVEIMPFLCKQMETVGQALAVADDGGGEGRLGGTSNDEHEAELGSSGDKKALHECFELLLNCLHTLLHWNGLAAQEHRQLLKNILNQFASRSRLEPDDDGKSAQIISTKQLATDAFEYLAHFTVRITSATLAVTLLKLLKRVLEFSPDDPHMKHRVGEIAAGFLTRNEWSDWRSVKADDLTYLIRQEISNSLLPLPVLENYIMVVIPAFFQRDIDALEATPLITRETFIVFYKAVSLELIQLLVSMDFKSSTDPDGNEQDSEEVIARGGGIGDDEVNGVDVASLIDRMHGIVKCWHGLVSVVKADDKKQVLTITMRYGRQFVDVFIKKALPMLDKVFRTSTDDVVAILKTLQNSTRSLQNVCSHSKVLKDTALTANVPQVRKSLEILLFRVKAMLDHNKCLNAFWIGNLKHRNIAGDEVSSQIPVEQDPESDEDDGAEDVVVQYDYDDEEEENNGARISKPTAKSKHAAKTARKRTKKTDDTDNGGSSSKKPRVRKTTTAPKPNTKGKGKEKAAAPRSLAVTKSSPNGRKLSSTQISSSDLESEADDDGPDAGALLELAGGEGDGGEDNDNDNDNDNDDDVDEVDDDDGGVTELVQGIEEDEEVEELALSGL